MKYCVLEMDYGIPTMVREDSDLIKKRNEWVVRVLFSGTEYECQLFLQYLEKIEEEKEKEKEMKKQNKFFPKLSKKIKRVFQN